PEPPARAVFRLAAGPPAPRAGPSGPRTVPDVEGLSLREAVRVLHQSGFNVRLVGGLAGTSPAAGQVAPAGSVVRLGARR
ncbi:MAG TPA: PASTA domain-containing protein, partial [Gemmatimonadales bacterium]